MPFISPADDCIPRRGLGRCDGIGYQRTMTATANDPRGRLPARLADLLPPDAGREARAVDIAIERFAAFGYERVKPPLVEFEESLLGGPGAALASQTFRLMDPVSQR